MFSKRSGKIGLFFRLCITTFSGCLQLSWSVQDVRGNSPTPPEICFSSLVAEYGYRIEGGRTRFFLIRYSFPESLAHNKRLLDEQQSIRSALHYSRPEGNGLLSTNQKGSPNKSWPFHRTGTSLSKAWQLWGIQNQAKWNNGVPCKINTIEPYIFLQMLAKEKLPLILWLIACVSSAMTNFLPPRPVLSSASRARLWHSA